MVKADISRDYYGDLGLDPSADPEAIKKQFKKLALAYHPDRNPGKESEVIGKFQKIQSAHEVLNDPQERMKYDAGRLRASGNAFRQSYGGPSASGMKGNPWSNAGAGYEPPPKPPTARKQPPPPSAGARRYNKFETPKTSASYAAQEGPEARRSAYEGWEHMRNPKSPESSRGGSTQSSARPARNVPPTPERSQHPEQGSFRRTAPAYDDWPGSEGHQPNSGSGVNLPRRAQSTTGTNRKGFMPTTPGGDEPAAPKGAYSGYNKKSNAPPPPPRNSPIPTTRPVPEPPRYNDRADPLFEPRVSTPYSTHGGEKLNPFESTDIKRAKSTRDRTDRFGLDGDMPRSGSSPNFQSSHPRSSSFASRPSPLKPQRQSAESPYVYTEPSSSSSESGPEMKMPTSPSARRYAKASSSSGKGDTKSHPGFQGPDPAPRAPPPPNMNGESMYAIPINKSVFSKQPPFLASQSTLPTVLESPNSTYSRFPSTQNNFHTAAADRRSHTWSNLPLCGVFSLASPGGTAHNSQSLNAFEDVQRTVVERILRKREAAVGTGYLQEDAIPESRRSTAQTHTPDLEYQEKGSSSRARNFQQSTSSDYVGELRPRFASHQTSPLDGPPMKQTAPFSSSVQLDQARFLRRSHGFNEENANKFDSSSFTFNVDDSTFQRTPSHPNGFRANSAENISTKFTPEDWDGKFAAGADYFRPEQKPANNPGRARAHSASRTRGRSPTKARLVDPIPPPADEPPLQSPGGTKFSAEEWRESFKPQTFAPPQMPVRSNTGSRKPRPNVRATAGTAAVVDDSDSSIEKRVFTGRRNSGKIPTPPSPDAMDVDTPPVPTKQATTPPLREPVHVKAQSPQKRAAAASSSTDAEAERLKVNFEDLKIRDLLSCLELPSPPKAPLPPSNTIVLSSTHSAYLAYKNAFKIYMSDWDLFNSRFLLHLVARKHQNDTLGVRRWEVEDGSNIYRTGLKEDGVVLGHLQMAMMGHEEVVREWKVVLERVRRVEIQAQAEGSGERNRQRMKMH